MTFNEFAAEVRAKFDPRWLEETVALLLIAKDLEDAPFVANSAQAVLSELEVFNLELENRFKEGNPVDVPEQTSSDD